MRFQISNMRPRGAKALRLSAFRPRDSGREDCHLYVPQKMPCIAHRAAVSPFQVRTRLGCMFVPKRIIECQYARSMSVGAASRSESFVQEFRIVPASILAACAMEAHVKCSHCGTF